MPVATEWGANPTPPPPEPVRGPMSTTYDVQSINPPGRAPHADSVEHQLGQATVSLCEQHKVSKFCACNAIDDASEDVIWEIQQRH